MDNNTKGYFIIESATEPMRPHIMEHERDDIVIKTVLQEAEAENRNKRVYAKDALMQAVNDSRFQEKLKRKSLFGEAGRLPFTY
ncbi:putative prohead core scaffold and protease [Bacillus phage vB_BpuM-BpSp]|nr:putative prohead core scaffold and protease [Bacillus phage vB_BpuM-BpSp]